MIRDLRYEEMERAERRSRLIKLGLCLVLTSAVATFAVGREVELHREWQRLPTAREGNLDSLKTRRDAIERMMESHTFWAGVFRASEERDKLVIAIANEERMLAQAAERAELQERRRLEEASASRSRALVHVERGDYDRAVAQFERALEMAPADWEHAAQVHVDLEALRKWSAEGGPGGQGDR